MADQEVNVGLFSGFSDSIDCRAYTHSHSPVGILSAYGYNTNANEIINEISIFFRNKDNKFINPRPLIEKYSKFRHLTINEVTRHTPYESNRRLIIVPYIPNYIPYPKGLVNKDNVLNEILKRD